MITESLLYGITSEDFVIKTYVIHWDTESSGVWSTLHVGVRKGCLSEGIIVALIHNLRGKVF